MTRPIRNPKSETRNDHSRLVYSTDGGRVTLPPPGLTNRAVPPKSNPKSEIRNPKSDVPDDGWVRVQRDKKGRGGKTATTVLTPGSTVGVYARRSDRGVAGELFIEWRRES